MKCEVHVCVFVCVVLTLCDVCVFLSVCGSVVVWVFAVHDFDITMLVGRKFVVEKSSFHSDLHLKL